MTLAMTYLDEEAIKEAAELVSDDNPMKRGAIALTPGVIEMMAVLLAENPSNPILAYQLGVRILSLVAQGVSDQLLELIAQTELPEGPRLCDECRADGRCHYEVHGECRYVKQ